MSLTVFFFVFPRNTEEKSVVDTIFSSVPEIVAEKAREVVGLQNEKEEDTNTYEEIPIKLFNFLWDYKLEIAVVTMFVITCILLSIIIYAAFSSPKEEEDADKIVVPSKDINDKSSSSVNKFRSKSKPRVFFESGKGQDEEDYDSDVYVELSTLEKN